MHQAIYTEKGAKPLGPYSQGIVAQGKLVFLSGQGPADVVQVNVFIADQSNFAVFNEIYARYVQEPYPARSTIEACLGQMGLEVAVTAVIQE